MRIRNARRTSEKGWRTSRDDLEPLIGVPSVNAGPVPLPAMAAHEPEPGLAAEQEDADA